MDTIPKKIHLISAEKKTPPQYAGFIDQMHALHPSWQINVWDDSTASAIVGQHFPDWQPRYDSYRLPVQRADIFRAIVVYLYGGFYLDMDMQCLKSLDDLCGNGMVLGVEKTLSAEECRRLSHKYQVRIANYMFGSMPGHGFWLDFLAAAKENSNADIKQEADILEGTGPGLFTNVYHENAHRYNNIAMLSNVEKACLKSCGPASCHFGDYAVHFHLGSWRWEQTLIKR